MSQPAKTAHLTPLERDALLAAFHSRTRSLVRVPGGYAANLKHQGPRLFTGRLMNMLDRDGLVEFDPPQFPERVVLNRRGLAVAEQLARELAGKAVRA